MPPPESVHGRDAADDDENHGDDHQRRSPGPGRFSARGVVPAQSKHRIKKVHLPQARAGDPSFMKRLFPPQRKITKIKRLALRARAPQYQQTKPPTYPPNHPPRGRGLLARSVYDISLIVKCKVLFDLGWPSNSHLYLRHQTGMMHDIMSLRRN